MTSYGLHTSLRRIYRPLCSTLEPNVAQRSKRSPTSGLAATLLLQLRCVKKPYPVLVLLGGAAARLQLQPWPDSAPPPGAQTRKRAKCRRSRRARDGRATKVCSALLPPSPWWSGYFYRTPDGPFSPPALKPAAALAPPV